MKKSAISSRIAVRHSLSRPYKLEDIAKEGLSASLSASLNCLSSSRNGLSASLLPHPLHKIARAGFALAAAHAWHVGELATEGDESVDLQRGAYLLLNDIEDFGGGEPLCGRVKRIVGDGEAEAEVLVGGFLYLVAAVPEHYLLGLCLVEPAATTVAQELQRLGEELMVVGHTTGVDGRREFDADETTVARRIGKDVGHVARGYERRLARQLLKVRAIRSFRLYRGQLDNVLQKTLLHTRRYLVELVEVDE